MKLALLLIPETDNTIDTVAYLTLCIERTSKDGCLAITPAHYNNGCGVNKEAFVDKFMPIAYSCDFGHSVLT